MAAKDIQVAAGIIVRGNQYLLSKRLAHAHQGGKWEFPGGKIEINESPEQALIRELKEEIDIDVQSARLFETLTYQYPEKRVTLHFYLVDEFTGIPNGNEGQAVDWFSQSELLSLEFPDANKPILEKIEKLL